MPPSEPATKSPTAERLRVGWCTAGGFVAILLWSTTVAVTRSLTEQLGPATAGAAVYLVGGFLGLVRLPRAHHQRPASRSSAQYRWGCGFLFVFYSVLLYGAIGSAQNREQVLEIGLINYLWPALTLLLAVPLLQKHARIGLVPGTLLALAGVLVVLTSNGGLSWRSFLNHFRNNPWAYGSAFLAAISWAAYSNLARRWTKETDEGAVRWFVLATGVGLLLIRLASPETSSWTVRSTLEVAFLGGMTTLAYALWERAMRHGDLVLVTACSYFTPFLSTLVNCFYLKVHVHARVWLGCALLIAGSLLSWLSMSPRAVSSSATPTAPSLGQETPP